MLAVLVPLAACGDDDDSAVIDSGPGDGTPADGAAADASINDGAIADATPPDGGPCDASGLLGCSPECQAGEVCVEYRTEHGFPTCNDYWACVETELECPPGDCREECAAALCPEPYACAAQGAGDFYLCSRP
jgi:hypothetical protein